jgi:hypothetical protein
LICSVTSLALITNGEVPIVNRADTGLGTAMGRDETVVRDRFRALDAPSGVVVAGGGFLVADTFLLATGCAVDRAPVPVDFGVGEELVLRFCDSRGGVASETCRTDTSQMTETPITGIRRNYH